MIAYFDASALVKRYVEEDGTADLPPWLAAKVGATSRLSELEITSAVARRYRQREWTSAARDQILQWVRGDLASMHVIELESNVVRMANDLLLRHPLRAGDAIQLASCLALANQFDPPPRFLSFDRRLIAAAEAEGLQTALD